MAKSSTERHMDWRNRVMLKARIFDDLNAERAARIRQAFPDDDRPEVRAVVEFFANYPRCQNAPASIDMGPFSWNVRVDTFNPFAIAAAKVAFSEITSVPVVISDIYDSPVPKLDLAVVDTVIDEVAEMRALGLWGRP